MFDKIKSYIQESRVEFSRVNWPTRQETMKLTFVVVGFSLAIAAFLGILDILFNYIMVNFVI